MCTKLPWESYPRPHISPFTDPNDRTQSWDLSVQGLKGVILGPQYHQLDSIDPFSNKSCQSVDETGTEVKQQEHDPRGPVRADSKVISQGDWLNKFSYHPASM